MSRQAFVENVPEMVKARPRSRKRLFIVCCLLLVLGVSLGGYYYVTLDADKRLSEAIARADQLEPQGWRLGEIEANREVIHEEQNAAIRVVTAKQLLRSLAPNEMAVDQALEELAPECELNPKQIELLRAYLKTTAVAVDKAREVADMPKGRHRFTILPNPIMINLPDQQDTRAAANLLSFDILLRLQEKDLAGAWTSCRALVNTSRTLGDEPTLISQLIRIAIRAIALGKLERILAQSEVPEETLESFQRFLEADEKEPLLLFGARGERGMSHAFMEGYKAGDIKLSGTLGSIGLGSGFKSLEGSPLEELAYSIIVGSKNNTHAALLEILTEFVEIAKLPVEEQRPMLAALDAKMRNPAQPFLVRQLIPAISKVAEACTRSHTLMRTAIAALAVERYRRHYGRWPDSLTELVPDYLQEVPKDPYDGAPLRFRRVEDGVVIYSVGVDGQDNGGNIRGSPMTPGSDIGIQLWDVAKRRQTPKPKPAEPNLENPDM